MISLILFFAIIASGSFFCACIGKQAEDVYPVTCMADITLLYFVGLIFGLKAGFGVVLAATVILYLAGIYFILFKNRWNTFRNNFFTKSGIVILFFVFLFLWCDVGMRGGKAVDDFSHWMYVVKQMSRLDDFGTNPLAGAGYGYYPPAMALFQYIFQKLYLLGKSSFVFSEWRCHYAYHILMLSMVFPFLKGWRNKKVYQPLIWMFTLIMLPTAFYFAYIDLSIDMMLAVVAGTGFARILLEKQKDIYYRVYICMECAMLAILKDAGITLAAFLAVAFVIDEAVVKKSKISVIFCRACSAAFSVAIPKLAWNWNINHSGIQRYFSATVDFRQLFQVLIGKDNTYRKEVVQAFVQAFFEKTVTIDYAGEANQPHLPMSYFALMLIFFFILSIVFVIHANINHESDLRKYKISGTILGLQFFVWVIGMLVAYITNFSEGEALQLASFGRYIHVVYLMLVVVLLLVLADIFNADWKYTSFLLIGTFIIVTLIAPAGYMAKYISRQYVKESYVQRENYDTPAKLVNEYCNSGDKILLIYQFAWNYPYHVNRFELYPQDISWILFTQDSDVQSKDFIDFEEFNYVIIQRNDDYFSDTYENLFDEQIEEGRIYKVDGSQRKLIKVH